METTLEDVKFKDQLSGSLVNSINQNRIADELLNLNIQDERFRDAVHEIDKVREFVGSPEKILGNDSTKHGEIAEQLEVGVRRAQQILKGDDVTATMEGVGRLAPEDYLIDGIKVQSKFINGTNNNLKAVLEHMDKYTDFGRDGSYYHIPKDEYEIIEKIRNNETVKDLNSRSITAIQEKVDAIEAETGKDFTDVVKPGKSTYAEVQKGKINETLDKKDNKIASENEKIKDNIREDHKPSLGEGLKATGTAAAVGGAISLTTSLYKKSKEGKKFYKGEFSSEDWKDIGIETAKGAATGGVTGGSIYALTNYASLSAPFAAAVVSATKSVGSLVVDYKNGEIEAEELYELGMIVCSESAIVGFATVAGQAIVPIPALGAVIGSLAGTLLANALGADNKITTTMLRRDLDNYLDKLDKRFKVLVEEITDEFNMLGELTEAAFDLENNAKLLNTSIELANAYGVEMSEILKNIEEIDAFMLS